MPDFLKYIIPLVETGRIKYDVDEREGGLDEFVSTVSGLWGRGGVYLISDNCSFVLAAPLQANDLFQGKNRGKLVLLLNKLEFPNLAA